MDRLRRRHQSIGLVATMGALHDGHLSMIRASVSGYGATAVTLFVNPLQFGPREEFRRYPRNEARDIRLARAAGADVVFAPAVSQMYPGETQTTIEIGPLAQHLEGASRPGHFRGVATVVGKLFNIVQPTHALFGQKDYQQALVVGQLVRDLNLPLKVKILPTVREPDGLAMSSRNQLLSPSQRRQAVVLVGALRDARARIRAGGRRARPIRDRMWRLMSAPPDVRVDYAAVVDAKTLSPLDRLRGRTALLVAAWVGRVRLIDNFLVEVS